MGRSILVSLEGASSDRLVVGHVKRLARAMNSNLTLLYVTKDAHAQDIGFSSAGQSLETIHAYLAQMRDELESLGIPAKTRVAYGDPVNQIIKRVTQDECDLVAMSCGSWADIRRRLFLGITTVSLQRHVEVPILVPLST